MKQVTLCIPLLETTGQVLLGEKLRGFGQGKVVGFGGKIEAGESWAQGAARELREESGLAAAPEELDEVAVLSFFFPQRPEWDHLVHVFLARAWQGAPTGSAEITAEWHSIAAIPYPRMWDDARFWLPRLLAGERLLAVFVYAGDNETVASWQIEPYDVSKLVRKLTPS